MRDQYLLSWDKFKHKDKQARLILSKIHRSIKRGQPLYRLSRRDITQINQAREAWFEFLRTARQ